MNARRILRGLAGYYIVTGALPLVSMRAFEAMTGPKTDKWLVRMVGLLAVSNGATFLIGAQERPSSETTFLAFASTASFAAIDVVYVLRRRISPVYLADAAIEIAFAGALAAALGRGENGRGRESTGESGT